MASSPLTPIPLLNVASRSAEPARIPASTDAHVENCVPLFSIAGVRATAMLLRNVALGAL